VESKLRLGKLSLTRRLTLFFTVVAAAVVLGLGGLFLVEIEQHFVELDRMALQEKRHLIEEILGNANSVDDASLRLSEALNYHHDLYVLVQNPQGERIFQSSTSNLNVQSGDALSTEETSVSGFGVTTIPSSTH
jgi:two-component system heavy metal sensor histidine kinase CusS